MSGAQKHHGSCLAERVRRDFDLFRKRPEVLYLDTAATSQHPDAVLHVRRAGGLGGGAGWPGRREWRQHLRRMHLCGRWLCSSQQCTVLRCLPGLRMHLS